MNKPIYKQIEDYLKELITSGQINQGELLPTENQLSEQFHVTRMTVRSAFNNLVKEGYIKRQRGIGSIVLDNKIHDNITTITSFTNELKSKGYEVETILISLRLTDADLRVSGALNIQEGENVWEIKRVRVANGKKVAYMTTYMPVKLFPNLNKHHCVTSLYDYVEKECGYTINNADRGVEAVIASEEVKELLDLKEITPLLYIQQVAQLKSGECFEYAQSYYLGYNLTLKVVNI